MDKNLGAWEGLYLMAQGVLYIINEGDFPHDIIYKCTTTFLELNIRLKVSVNGIVLLLSRQVVVQVYDEFYDLFPMLNSGVFF